MADHVLQNFILQGLVKTASDQSNSHTNAQARTSSTIGVHTISANDVLSVKTHVPNTIDPNATVAAILDMLQTVQSTHLQSHSLVAVHNDKLGFGPSPTLIDVGSGGSGYYDDYSGDYGWWDAGGGIDFGGSNADSDGPSRSSDAPAMVHLTPSVGKTDGTDGYVNVYFSGVTSDHKNGDQAVTQNLSTVTTEILAATPGVNFVNVSATTNGVHDTHSDHASGNAVDINKIDGIAIITSQGTALALQLEAQALADTSTRYVEGPGGNWVRTTEGGQWQHSKDLPTMWDHVHWSTFRD